jgi:hypothetical protein
MSANLSDALVSKPIPVTGRPRCWPTAGSIRSEHAGRDLGATVSFVLIGLVITFLVLALSPAWEGGQALALAG